MGEWVAMAGPERELFVWLAPPLADNNVSSASRARSSTHFSARTIPPTPLALNSVFVCHRIVWRRNSTLPDTLRCHILVVLEGGRLLTVCWEPDASSLLIKSPVRNKYANRSSRLVICFSEKSFPGTNYGNVPPSLLLQSTPSTTTREQLKSISQMIDRLCISL